jgi:16S rRNA (guanine527-N7)-methyltransferase
MLSIVYEEIVAMARTLSIALSEQQLSQFTIHVDLLKAWNRKMNLTAIENPVELARRHFCEGIIAGNWLSRNSAGGTLLDLGSGNGFPAVPMAIIAEGVRPIILVESSEKRSAFLRALIRELDWDDARVEQRRARKSSDLSDFPCQIFSTRGVAISNLLGDGLPFLQSGGCCVLFGSTASFGIGSPRFPKALTLREELCLPGRDSGVLLLSKS